MKFLNAIPEEQETLINFLYEEEIIKVYSNKIETIRKLKKELGNPSKKFEKNKKFWTGAEWEISFHDLSKINKILNKDIFVEKDFKPQTKKRIRENDKKAFYQISLDLK